MYRSPVDVVPLFSVDEIPEYRGEVLEAQDNVSEAIAIGATDMGGVGSEACCTKLIEVGGAGGGEAFISGPADTANWAGTNILN